MQALSFPLFFKVPLSNLKKEPQEIWAVCISRLQCCAVPTCQQRLAGAVGQTKLHHKDTNDKAERHKQEVFRTKRTGA